MRTKDKTVSLEGMNPAMWPMAMRVNHVYLEVLGYELVVTSGSEPDPDPNKPVHKEGSFHYPENTPDKMGRAIDCRTHISKFNDLQLVGASRAAFHSKVQAAAGKDFQVIDERNHLHIELDR